MKTIAVIGKAAISPLVDGKILPRCEVICATEITEIQADAVLVLGRGAHPPIRMDVAAVVVNSDSGFDAELLHGMAVITCGHSGKDTVSVTSRTAERITLSLNRSLRTHNGICEPLELPLPMIEGMDDYDYMAAFAAAVVMGMVE